MFISFLCGAADPLLCSLPLSLSLSLCLEGKPVKPRTFPFTKKSHREQRPRQEATAPQMAAALLPPSAGRLAWKGPPRGLGFAFSCISPEMRFQ